MKKHEIIDGCTDYPVGHNIVKNLPIIKNMGNAIIEILIKYYNPIECVILFCKGSSGAIISAIVSDMIISKLNIHVDIYHIKKEGEKSHQYNSLPAINSVTKLIIIDDFIDTGSTIQSIINELVGYDRLDILCVTGDKTIQFEDNFDHIIQSI